MAAHTTWREPARRSIPAAIAIVGIMLLAIGSVKAGTVTVKAVNFEFQPPSRTINVGDAVTWTFSGETHTVTSGTPGAPDGRFDSGFKTGGSFKVTFDKAGTFRYFCQIHSEQMMGEIIVKAGATPTPRPTPKASPKPTPKPTARPTSRPTARPTAAPTQAPAPTAARTEAPTASPTEAPTDVPTASPTASPAQASSEPSVSVAPSPAASNVSGGGNAAASMDPAAIVAIAIAIGLLAVGGLALARRSRRV